jgi:hypothetical protein
MDNSDLRGGQDAEPVSASQTKKPEHGVVAPAGRRCAAGVGCYPVLSTLRDEFRRKSGPELVALILPGKMPSKR